MKLFDFSFFSINNISQYLITCDDLCNFRLVCRVFSCVKMRCNHQRLSTDQKSNNFDLIETIVGDKDNLKGPTIINSGSK